VFVRGASEGLRVVRKSAWSVELYDLISAYGSIRARNEPAVHFVGRRQVMTLDEALTRVERLLGTRLEWAEIRSFLPETQDGEYRRSALASSFVAALELARQGKLQLDQQAAFEPLYIRAA
jgi:segregation and condensation protein A